MARCMLHVPEPAWLTVVVVAQQHCIHLWQARVVYCESGRHHSLGPHPLHRAAAGVPKRAHTTRWIEAWCQERRTQLDGLRLSADAPT